MRYDVSALEVLKILGYTPKAMDEWMGKTKIDLPQIYRDFLELTKDCALFQTACLDTGNKGSSEMLLQTLYETMQAEIADWKETWEQEPETRETEIYTFSLLPPVRWSEKVENFLLIGNEDGVVQLGPPARCPPYGYQAEPSGTRMKSCPIFFWKCFGMY